MQLGGKAAIVTGSGTGVGRETALALARLGCDVAVNYSRSRTEAEQTCAEVCALGVHSIAVAADVSRDEDCRALVQAALDAFGRLDVLVNNAGTTKFVPHGQLDDVSGEDFQRIMGVNVVGPFQMARAARTALEASGQGVIINVSSVAGLRAVGSSIPYCASKAALNNMTIALARALAPKIRVNAVAPGFITGRWLQEGLGADYDAVLDHQRQRTPLGRVCDPIDVANAIVALTTAGDMVTGTVLPVEGGMLIHA